MSLEYVKIDFIWTNSICRFCFPGIITVGNVNANYSLIVTILPIFSGVEHHDVVFSLHA